MDGYPPGPHVGVHEAQLRYGQDHSAKPGAHEGVPGDVRDYTFPVLADADRAVVKAYGVYVRANLESINIARPANFVLDGNGVIA
jgi:hypothetical protein